MQSCTRWRCQHLRACRMLRHLINLLRVHAWDRWDQCWIRLLDGMLQLSVAGTRDYELRIPTRIRSIVIKSPEGTPDGQISVRAPTSQTLPGHPPALLHAESTCFMRTTVQPSSTVRCPWCSPVAAAPLPQVKMDRFMGCVDNELASITGLELTVAPRRPAHTTHKCACHAPSR